MPDTSHAVLMNPSSPLVCVKVLQETVGGAVVVGSSSDGGGQDWQGQGCGFRPNRQDVFEFIRQCGTKSANEPDGVSEMRGHTRTNTHTHSY